MIANAFGKRTLVKAPANVSKGSDVLCAKLHRVVSGYIQMFFSC